MKVFAFWIVYLISLSISIKSSVGVDIDEDNDFAEFAEFDDEEFETTSNVPENKKQDINEFDQQANVQAADEDEEDDDDATVEDEDDDEEFEHLSDDQEFVGFSKGKSDGKASQEKPPDLKINKIPYHLRTNWDSFYLEMLMLAGLAVYLLNFLHGKSKNHKLASAWFQSHKELLEANFAVVGDDGQTKEEQSGILMKESENIYNLWCSGRVCCEGMLVTLKFLKRQDLVSTIAQKFKPTSDQITIKVTFDDGAMDSFVFCLASKKACTKLHKEMTDLSLFCTEKKSAEKFGLPKSMQLLSEIPEASNAIFDRQVITAINKYETMIEYLHFSDQYSGPRQQDDGSVPKSPETSKVLVFCFNVPDRGHCTPKNMEDMKPLMQMVFHIMDKVRKLRLSKEAKAKAEKTRQKIEEGFLKLSHQSRVEAAQQRKEDKRRAEKEKMMMEEDPEKQRKWEDRENRREMKKKQGKVKMMKAKAM